MTPLRVNTSQIINCILQWYQENFIIQLQIHSYVHHYIRFHNCDSVKDQGHTLLIFIDYNNSFDLEIAYLFFKTKNLGVCTCKINRFVWNTKEFYS